MHFSSDKLRLSSPIKSQHKIYNSRDTLDQQYLYDRLNTIMFTLQAQKEDFQQKINTQKDLLKQQLSLKQQKIKQLQLNQSKLQQQCRQLRFNYHQRGSVVQYLKKKITALEKKFDSQKQQMISIIKYLQNKNSQLNESIFVLKKKQLELSQNISRLEEKYIKCQYEGRGNKHSYENNSYLINHMQNFIDQKPIVTQRRSMCHKKQNSILLTPQYMQKKIKTKNKLDLPFSMRQPHNFQMNYLSVQDSNNQSLAQSSTREKTVKYDNGINRVKSSDQFDFYDNQNEHQQYSSLNHQNNRKSSLGIKNPYKFIVQGQGHNPQKIWINNYGQLNLNNNQQYITKRQLGHQFPKSKLKKQNFINQNHHNTNRPKLSLPYNARYGTEINSYRRKNNQI